MKIEFSPKSSVVSRKLLLTACYGALIISLVSCNGGGNKNATTNATMSREACIDSIRSVEAKLKTLKTPDPYTFNMAITAYTRFASNFPNDTMAPSSLFNAAGIAMSLNQYQRAVSLYDTINTKYPTFRKAADCMFIRGFIYDDKLKDTAKARAMYQMVIDKYPNDSLATQARAAIAILGKSYDEIIKEFEEKNKGKK
jgi:TolA-binding protein